MKRTSASLLLLFAGGCCIASAATIMGSVSDSDGSVLAGAQVNLTPTPSMSRGSASVAPVPTTVISVTASDAGQFEFDNLAPGKYSLD